MYHGRVQKKIRRRDGQIRRFLPGNPTVLIVADQNTRKETGALQNMQHATNVIIIQKGPLSESKFSKTVQPLLVNSELSLDTAFVGSVNSKQQSSWTTTLQVRGRVIRFKIDTGAEVTGISEETFRQLGGASLQRPCKVLYGPARHTLDVLGQFMTTQRHEQRSSLQPVFVVRRLKNNLLGLLAIVALQLIHRVSSVKTEDNIRKMFPKVFSGLGMLGEPYQIKLKEGALPHSIYAPRTVAERQG